MVSVPIFTLKYAGKDITADIKPYALSVRITDKLEGESDEVEIELENSDFRWMNGWIPKEADLISASIGYEKGLKIPEVSAEIDEPEYSGSPDTVRLKGLVTPISSTLRQRRSQAYENVTLRDIAKQIAQRHNLELVGEVPDLKLERVTQKEQTDLEFLLEQSQEFGLVFKVESASRLVFFRIEELEKARAIATINRVGGIKNYRLKRTAAGTYKAAKISYYNSKTGKYLEATVDAAGNEVPKPADKEQEQAVGDVLNIRVKVENLTEARERAKEELRRANSSRITMDLELEGDPRLSAGVNVQVDGFFKFSGKYLIEEVQHNLRRSSGYAMSLKLRKVEEG